MEHLKIFNVVTFILDFVPIEMKNCKCIMYMHVLFFQLTYNT